MTATSASSARDIIHHTRNASHSHIYPSPCRPYNMYHHHNTHRPEYKPPIGHTPPGFIVIIGSKKPDRVITLYFPVFPLSSFYASSSRLSSPQNTFSFPSFQPLPLPFATFPPITSHSSSVSCAPDLFPFYSFLFPGPSVSPFALSPKGALLTVSNFPVFLPPRSFLAFSFFTLHHAAALL